MTPEQGHKGLSGKGMRVNKNYLLITLAIGVLLFRPATGSAAPLAGADFKYCAEISGPLDKNILYQVHLPAEVLEQCAAGFADARILDPENREIPRVVLEEIFPAETPDVYPFEITGYHANPSSSTITMKLPDKHRAISVLDLEIPDRDFKKHVLLSGSSDNKTWRQVAEDDIYDFSSQVDLRKTKLQFTAADERFFKLTLIDSPALAGSRQAVSLKYQGLDFNVQAAGKKDIRIHAIEGRTAANSAQPAVYDERVLGGPSVAVDKDGNSIVLFRAGLPVDRFALDIANPYFYRAVMLYASETGKEDSYTLIARQQLYRFPLSARRQESRNTIEKRVSKPFYKIVIQNRSNPPLEIRKVTLSWIRKDLYFMALSNSESYSLCFGNSALTPPDYDLQRFVTTVSVRQQQYRPGAMGQVRENAGFVPAPPGEKKAKMERKILSSVVVLLVIGMGFWLYSLMKKAGQKK